ncbi:MAG TPA: NAD(P)-dependent methylenetetrahydromethanopterin dehydrogenase [Gemmatimonadaceae bacterium]|nr:NAD(P)-dependent methylenetetrahydromethanopterin dehydrogenase [Gemmatimonadaceae bacterium]
MRKLLLHLDTSRLPSAFDQIVAYDAGADVVMAYGGVAEADVRDLIHGCIFTRGLKELRNTACFIGGADMEAGQRLLKAAEKSFFGPFRVSVMLDSNGSNTTAVAAVEKIFEVVPDVGGKRAVVTAGTGPVGLRVAGLLVAAGAEVAITSRTEDHGEKSRVAIRDRFKGDVDVFAIHSPEDLERALDGADILCNCGPAGIQLVPRRAWENRPTLRVVVDLNAVPPAGVEGIDPNDNGKTYGDIVAFGALGTGGLKMKIHKASVAHLFTRNDAVLDAESIAELAHGLVRKSAARA